MKKIHVNGKKKKGSCQVAYSVFVCSGEPDEDGVGSAVGIR